MLVLEHQNENADRVGPYVLKGVGNSALSVFADGSEPFAAKPS